MPLSLIHHPSDGLHRCSWCGQGDANLDYIHYHDHEWGMPVSDEIRLFEKITLEGFQSGLSWITVLRKRDRFRTVFKGFDFEQVARFTDKDIERLVLDAGIIRHRGKIVSCINNARQLCNLIDAQGPGALARLVWRHEPARPPQGRISQGAARRFPSEPDPASRPATVTPETAPTLTQSPESVALSKALKKLGFSFVGPTTMYAFMQSMGVVNDHLDGCHHHGASLAARATFVRPA